MLYYKRTLLFIFILLFNQLTSVVLARETIANVASKTSVANTDAISEKPKLQHAKLYQEHIDLSRYWVSEKLDGVRGYYNGKQLITRQGKRLNPPSWFTAHWPKTVLDGELWSKRDDFDFISGCVRRKKADLCWRKLKLMVFDLPQSTENFTGRINQLKVIIQQSASPYLAMIKQEKIASKTALYNKLDLVIANKGEGLMLHNGDAFYQHGRNSNILKLKKYQDAEAIVLEHISGKGKYQHMLGALKVKTLDDKAIIFHIGTGFSDQQRQQPPDIGSIITYKYLGKTKRGIPRFASFVRISPSE